MRKAPILLIIFLVQASLALGQSISPQEQSVLDLSKRKFDWLIGKQYDSLAALLDDKVQYTHSNGWVQNKKEVIEDTRSGKLDYRKVTVKEAAVHLYGSAAVVTGMGKFEGIRDATPFTLDLRYTEVYVKMGNRWKLVSRHANRMP